MEKQKFTHDEAVLGMAGLALTIQVVVDAISGKEGTYPTEVILSQYNLTERDFEYALCTDMFAVYEREDGKVFFSKNTDAREMGYYDDKRKTFLWSRKGFLRVVSLLAKQGRYPADFVIRTFIGDEDPVEIIRKLKIKN